MGSLGLIVLGLFRPECGSMSIVVVHTYNDNKYISRYNIIHYIVGIHVLFNYIYIVPYLI